MWCIVATPVNKIPFKMIFFFGFNELALHQALEIVLGFVQRNKERNAIIEVTAAVLFR